MGPKVLTGMFSWLESERLSVTPSGTLAEYRDFLSQLHIGLAPLLPTEFNRCRSDVKFLEYASAGAAALCSDLDPYRFSVRHGDTGLLWRTLDDLHTCLCQAIENEALRTGLREQAHGYVERQRLERCHAPERLSFYRAWWTARSSQPPAAQRRREILEILDRHAPLGHSPNGAYHVLQPGDLEKMLYNGLLGQANAEEALREFLEASRHTPGYYLPHLYAGKSEPDPSVAIERLKRALELNPHSCNAAHLLGVRHQERGNREEAVRFFSRALQIAPDYAPAREGLGRICEQAGKLSEACEHYEGALRYNPFYRNTATRLAMICLEVGEPENARRLLEENLASGENGWLDHFLLGRVFLEQERFADARVHLERARRATTEPAAVLAQLAKAHLGLGDCKGARRLLSEIGQIQQRPPEP